MQISMPSTLLVLVALLMTQPVLGQDTESDAEQLDQQERIARIADLRETLRLERQEMRQDIQRRLDDLSPDEREALQERRQLLQLPQGEQKRRRERLRRLRQNTCPC